MSINPALADLQPLVGRWWMELYNADFLPDRDTRLSGSIEIDWIEDGSVLRMRQGDSEHHQAAVWIIGPSRAKLRWVAVLSFSHRLFALT